MARLEFFVVSKSVAVDQATNFASVLEILEVIQTAQFPALIPECVAFSLWRAEPGDADRDHQLVLRITSPGGVSNEIRSSYRLTTPRHRVLQRIQGLPVEKDGRIRFELILNGQHAAEHVVDVQRGPAAEGPASPLRVN